MTETIRRARDADAPVVSLRHITVSFPGVLAADDVSLDIRRGEIFALVGENGAGKSTLMNVLYGLCKPRSGEIVIKGHAVERHSPKNAIRLGVGMVHQHFRLVPSFTVAQNIVLCREPKRGKLLYDFGEARRLTAALSEEYGLAVRPDDRVSELSVGLQQRVEILKTLFRGADVLILDEPTAVLTPQETNELFAVIRRVVREKQMTVILITHKLYEVTAVSDRVGVMRQGRLIDVLPTASVDERKLAALMVGRDVLLPALTRAGAVGEAALCVHDLRAEDDRGLPALRGVSLTVQRGEILGVAGVEGNGQSELAECLTGLRAASGGTFTVFGSMATGRSPREIRAMGVAHIPEDRMTTGISTRATLWENLLLGRQRAPEYAWRGVHLKRARVRERARALMARFDIRAPGIDTLAGELSGGNMQKVVVAREFSFDAPILVVSQPTRGVDIGATAFIHERIVEKRDAGCAVLLVSADLDELMRLSDRIVTLYEGRVTREFHAGAMDKAEIGFCMTGGGDGADAPSSGEEARA